MKIWTTTWLSTHWRRGSSLQTLGFLQSNKKKKGRDVHFVWPIKCKIWKPQKMNALGTTFLSWSCLKIHPPSYPTEFLPTCESHASREQKRFERFYIYLWWQHWRTCWLNCWSLFCYRVYCMQMVDHAAEEWRTIW